jgi:hypothetical protein
MKVRIRSASESKHSHTLITSCLIRSYSKHVVCHRQPALAKEANGKTRATAVQQQCIPGCYLSSPCCEQCLGPYVCKYVLLSSHRYPQIPTSECTRLNQSECRTSQHKFPVSRAVRYIHILHPAQTLPSSRNITSAAAAAPRAEAARLCARRN